MKLGDLIHEVGRRAFGERWPATAFDLTRHRTIDVGGVERRVDSLTADDCAALARQRRMYADWHQREADQEEAAAREFDALAGQLANPREMVAEIESWLASR